MSQKQEVEIKFYNLYNKWRWHVSYGVWQTMGYGDNLKDAEKHAFNYVKGIPNHGTIHALYEGGKTYEMDNTKMADNFIKSNYDLHIENLMEDGYDTP